MRPASRAQMAVAAALVGIGSGGCGQIFGIEDTTVAPDAGGPDGAPPASDHQFVASSLTVPATSSQVSDLGLDIDGENGPDNAIGSAIAILIGQGIDVVAGVQEGVGDGSTIALINVLATELGSATDAAVDFYLGENPAPPACTDPGDIETCHQHLEGDASFDIAAVSPTASPILGDLAAGDFETTAPGQVSLALRLLVGSTPVEMDLIGARARFRVTDDGNRLSGGILGGAVTEDEMANELVPALHGAVEEILAGDCGAGPAPDCCEPGSTGEGLLDLFDTDGDCVVTQAEFQSSALVQSALAPDVDLLDAEGNFDPESDGVNDSTSIGLGFTAVGASFTSP